MIVSHDTRYCQGLLILRRVWRYVLNENEHSHHSGLELNEHQLFGAI